MIRAVVCLGLVAAVHGARSKVALVHTGRSDASEDTPFFWKREANGHQSMDKSDLSQSLLQLMGAPVSATPDSAALPSRNPMGPPTGHVVISVEGMEPSQETTPYLHDTFTHHPSAHVSHPSRRHDVSEGITADVTDRVYSGLETLGLDNGYRACFSADHRVHSNMFCATAREVMRHEMDEALDGSDGLGSKTMRVMDREGRGHVRGGAGVSGKGWRVHADGVEKEAVFDPSSSTADALLLKELDQLLAVPDKFDAVPAHPHRPRDVVVSTVNALPHVAEEHGLESHKYANAKALTDAVLRKTVTQLGERRSGRVLATILLDNSDPALPLSPTANRYLTDATPAPTVYNHTIPLDDIVAYQINMWTGVVLVIAVLAAICCMLNMDIQPDSLLYAKFQADTSSKLD